MDHPCFKIAGKPSIREITVMGSASLPISVTLLSRADLSRRASHFEFPLLDADAVILSGRAIFEPDEQGTTNCALVNLSTPQRWSCRDAAELIAFILPRPSVAVWAADNGYKGFRGLASGLESVPDIAPPKEFARALQTSLTRPQAASQSFTDYVLEAFCRYMVDSYGVADTRSRTGGLAPWQERLATEMMSRDFSAGTSLAMLADSCRLSLSHFAKAFRETLGVSPHQWLIHYRLEEAKKLLASEHMSIADIASACGFADQSHFTRAFKKYADEPPGLWRQRETAFFPSTRRPPIRQTSPSYRAR